MLRKISLISFIIALLGIVTPLGFEAMVMYAGVASSLTLRNRPAVSSVAFMINFFNILAHIPGLAFPESDFASGILSFGGPLHWGFLAAQLPIILAGVFLTTSMGAPPPPKRSHNAEADFAIRRPKDSLF